MPQELKVAYYVTPHGLGHATRSMEIITELLTAGQSVVVLSSSQVLKFVEANFSASLRTRCEFREAVLDCGAVQSDAFTVDPAETLTRYHALACQPDREERIQTEKRWLLAAGVDVVATDVVPLACRAGREAGCHVVCVGNFTWDYIFDSYSTDQLSAGAVEHMKLGIRDDYACACLLLRMPGFTPMPAFAAVTDVPLVVRTPVQSAEAVRTELGIPEDKHIVLLMYGAHALALEPEASWLPADWVCVAATSGSQLTPSGCLPPNFRLAPADAYVPDLMLAAEAVIGKLGYGCVSECIATRTPLLYVRRPSFDEEPFMLELLQRHGAAVELPLDALRDGRWAPYLSITLECKLGPPCALDGASVVADLLQAGTCSACNRLQVSDSGIPEDR